MKLISELFHATLSSKLNHLVNALVAVAFIFNLDIAQPVSAVSDTQGPQVSSASVNPTNVGGTTPAAITISATVSDAFTGGNLSSAAEYYIDSIQIAGTGVNIPPVVGSTPGVTRSFSVSLSSYSGLSTGAHTVYIRGKDALGNWGSVNFAVFTLDLDGPQTISVTLTPAGTHGTVDVAILGTASDASLGGSDIISSRFSVGSNPALYPLTVTLLDTDHSIAALSGTIPAVALSSLPEGIVSIHIQSQDAYLQWGQFATGVQLKIDKTGPEVLDNPDEASPEFFYFDPVSLDISNGVSPVADIYLFASFQDKPSGGVNSLIADAHWKINYCKDLSTLDQPMLPNQTTFNLSSTAAAYAKIPALNFFQMAQGYNTVFVQGLDGSGNWGEVKGRTIYVNRGYDGLPGHGPSDIQGPDILGLAANPPITNVLRTTTLTAMVTDPLIDPNITNNPYLRSTIHTARWSANRVGGGSGPHTGLFTSMDGCGFDKAYSENITATLDVKDWLPGYYDVLVEVQDGSFNWSSQHITILVPYLMMLPFLAR